MRLGVVLLDVLELRGVVEGGHVPVQVADPPVQVRVAGAHVAQVALEVLHVHAVEAHDGGVEAHVGLGQPVAEVVRARAPVGVGGEVRLGAVQAAEQRGDGGLVRVGRGGEAGLVHAVVDVVVGPVVGALDLGPEVLREQVHRRPRQGQLAVEDAVEHADDLARLVGHDPVRLPVVQRGHQEAARVVRILGEVDVAQVRVLRVQRVRPHVGAGQGGRFGGGGEAPAWASLSIGRSWRKWVRARSGEKLGRQREMFAGSNA